MSGINSNPAPADPVSLNGIPSIDQMIEIGDEKAVKTFIDIANKHPDNQSMIDQAYQEAKDKIEKNRKINPSLCDEYLKNLEHAYQAFQPKSDLQTPADSSLPKPFT